MKVSKQLKKQMVIEVIALFFLVGVIIYASFAIKKSNENKVTNYEGMVLVLDDSKFTGLSISSDGAGFNTEGVTYTVTNNNKEPVKYKVEIVPNVHDEDIINKIRVGIDDMYAETLSDLERDNGAYVLTSVQLDPGYTKIHLFKYWLKLESDQSLDGKEITFDYKVVKE